MGSPAVSRRGFLAGGAAGLASVSLATCAPEDDDRPGQRSAAPADRFDAPTDQLNAPAGRLNAPNSRLDAPTGRLNAPTGTSDEAWADVRARFVLEPGVAYMNNASLGMPPASVAEAVGVGYEALSREPLRAKNELSATIADRVVPGLASLLGADPDELALTRNASEALHLASFGVRVRRGDEVLTTTQEHPAGLRPWEMRAERHGVVLKKIFVPSPLESADQVVALVEEAITPATRVVAFCHVTRGGHLYPVRRLCALARAHGCVSHVDGAQAVGLLPVDLHDLGCDTYSASLHKWFLGPMGTGVLYVRADARERVASVFAPGTAEGGAAYRPPGTSALPLRAALAASLEFMEDVTVASVESRTRHLSDHLKVRLAKIEHAKPLSGTAEEVSSPGSTIFELEGVDAVEAVGLVAERAKMHIDEHQRDGHNALRVSTHVYNTEAEIDRLAGVLEELTR